MLEISALADANLSAPIPLVCLVIFLISSSVSFLPETKAAINWLLISIALLILSKAMFVTVVGSFSGLVASSSLLKSRFSNSDLVISIIRLRFLGSDISTPISSES